MNRFVQAFSFMAWFFLAAWMCWAFVKPWPTYTGQMLCLLAMVCQALCVAMGCLYSFVIEEVKERKNDNRS